MKIKYCTHHLYDNTSISQQLFLLTQNQSHSEGKLTSTFFGRGYVAQGPGGLVILGSESIYRIFPTIRRT